MRVISSSQAIPVRPEIVRILGRDLTAAYYYQQMVFYDGRESKDAEGYFRKSKVVIERDTALTRYQQDRARAKLVGIGWIAARHEFVRGSQTSAVKVLRYPS